RRGVVVRPLRARHGPRGAAPPQGWLSEVRLLVDRAAGGHTVSRVWRSMKLFPRILAHVAIGAIVNVGIAWTWANWQPFSLRGPGGPSRANRWPTQHPPGWSDTPICTFVMAEGPGYLYQAFSGSESSLRDTSNERLAFM